MSDIELRPMHENDLKVVSELALLANPHAEKETYKKHILDELRENPDLSFVAASHEKVVGYAQGDIRGAMATLEDLAVAKEFQQKGLGSKLLSVELEALKKRGSKIVVAEVHWKNAEAIPFYYKHGFRLSGCAQDFFGIGHDTIILKRFF